VAGQLIFATHHRVAGSQLLRLQRERDIRVMLERGPDFVGLVANNNNELIGPGFTGRIKDVFHHRSTTGLMQDLGGFRLHPLAFSGSENDSNCVGHAGSSSRVCG